MLFEMSTELFGFPEYFRTRDFRGKRGIGEMTHELPRSPILR
jgi:hypothetical protein